MRLLSLTLLLALAARGADAADGLAIVQDGQARVRVETDGSGPARFAADLVKRNVVLLAGVALPEGGTGPALAFRIDERPGYRIEVGEGGAVVHGADPVRAAYDLLEAWGCRFDGKEPEIPRRTDLAVRARAWRPERELWIEASRFAPWLPLSGVAFPDLASYDPALAATAASVGYGVRVASDTFDDFLPPARFEQHPEWFALRQGERTARGNFALTCDAARAAYLDAVGAWLEAHPEVTVLGLWPEVTTVWCEESAALGHAEAYALLWREAAARFPERRFEILATGLTLRPPGGAVPANVEVRLRPGRDASALQGVVGQEIETIVRAWEARGAKVVLEIDPAPESWCGMPWPIHEAVRADARRFRAAVLRGEDALVAAIWRSPDRPPPVPPPLAALLARARGVHSWGHPRDAADLFLDDTFPDAYRIACVERLLRLAEDAASGEEERRSAAADAYLGYRDVLERLPPERAAAYRRYRERDQRRVMEELLPEGVARRVGPAAVRETFDRIEIETDRLALVVDRDKASVVSVRRRLAQGWSDDLAGGQGRYFAAVALGATGDRSGGGVRLSAPGATTLRIDLEGSASGTATPTWSTTIELHGGSSLVHQVARASVPGGVAAGCRWAGGAGFDHWVCPSYATEGEVGASVAAGRPGPVFQLVPETLFYCRRGETGPGLAARLPRGGVVSLTATEDGAQLVATTPGSELKIEWVLFTDTGELGK